MEEINAFVDRVFVEQYQERFGKDKADKTLPVYLTLTRKDEQRLKAVLRAKLVLENAHITDLVVDQPYRGQGLGASLMAELEAILSARGIRSITLSTKSYQAEGFYRKLGYQVYGTLIDVPQVGVTKYHLVKYLNECHLPK
ncbi:GNAT family N-acetyltransferase [Streptococcus ovuberis]|uniref:GNAT family N-acetyltransferase n=1 Tax=Streptococcus ovuberis TaxID=1936207 RepID=A0A7X6MXG7_9STRE|nr:GNAT family N-acetyltransferase [Streptococcus ovuberis]NKZ19716.1 GNAT family N-acetyltransferase [Streptococcus ovuberis]